jgi:hypothetical protein
MNKDAGRGGHLMVTLRLESGEKLPFVVDTGAACTLFEKSQVSKLGKPIDKGTLWNFGVPQETASYAAPKLYLGSTLLMTGTNVASFDFKKLASHEGRPVMGILGMDVLQHYCVQLDFAAGKMRFLDDERADKKDWGRAFSLTDLGDGCFIIGENLVGAKGAGSLIDTGYVSSDGWLTPSLFQKWTNHAPVQASSEARSPNGLLGGETYPELDLQETDEKSVLSHDSHTEFNGIGLHVLSQNTVTLDFPTKTMYLKRTSTWPLVDKAMETRAKTFGESAVNFLKSLKKKDRLPGFSKNDEVADRKVDFHFHYPDSGTFDVAKKGDPARYHYQVARGSKHNPWKIQKAWRTDENDRTIEEYPVP